MYVIELPDAVAQRENPDREIVYVGMTSRTVEERFQQHLQGHHSARVIKRVIRLGLGSQLRLRPDLMRRAGNPQPNQHEALIRERALTRRLKRRGYTVFSN
ncbi:MAG: GIY-YIG nuclease family protein [Chloroflexi bacterium]|nr:GIY-YIG nuclease family protein [Chloroflexota bacterium]